MTPEELVQAVEQAPPPKVRCKVCESEYRAHVDALLDQGYTPYKIELLMAKHMGHRVSAGGINHHANHRRAADSG